MFHQIHTPSKHIVWKVPKFKAGLEPELLSRHFSFVPSGETSSGCVYQQVCASAYVTACGCTRSVDGPK